MYIALIGTGTVDITEVLCKTVLIEAVNFITEKESEVVSFNPFTETYPYLNNRNFDIPIVCLEESVEEYDEQLLVILIPSNLEETPKGGYIGQFFGNCSRLN